MKEQELIERKERLDKEIAQEEYLLRELNKDKTQKISSLKDELLLVKSKISECKRKEIISKFSEENFIGVNCAIYFFDDSYIYAVVSTGYLWKYSLMGKTWTKDKYLGNFYGTLINGIINYCEFET